mmetsp:Transcript_59688/g.90007  ORF Transcript_59688/g.90007 Transcript_59688/m.90007 type:complete len:119 (-) Transcript_59688:25-381(-)
MYCSNLDGDDCTNVDSKTRLGLEDLFMKYGVDIIFTAHEHSYERSWPVYNYTVERKNYTNPGAPFHIVTGNAGCNEALGTCMNPILKSGGDWSAYWKWFFSYGYGHLEIFNSTHLYYN